MIGYLHTRQHIPLKRIQEYFHYVPISEYGLHYLLGKLVKKAKPAYEMIKNKLALEMVGFISSDETGAKIGGNKYWVWTWQNEKATFITITDNRAQRSITDTIGSGFENAVLVQIAGKVILTRSLKGC